MQGHNWQMPKMSKMPKMPKIKADNHFIEKTRFLDT